MPAFGSLAPMPAPEKATKPNLSAGKELRESAEGAEASKINGLQSAIPADPRSRAGQGLN